MAAARVSKAEFDRRVPELRDELLDLQLELRTTAKCAVALIITGTPGAGRSESVNQLLEWLDPKYIGVQAFDGREDADRPVLWRYWQGLPPQGRMTFFLGGWYGDYMGLATRDTDKARKHEKRAVERILQLEQMLAKDSVRVVKIHLHTDKKTQRRRLAELLASKLTRWRVTDEDRWMAKHYDEVSRGTKRCLKATDHPAAPWHIVDGTDEEYRLLTVGTILRDGMRDALRAAREKPAAKQQRHAKVVALHVRQPAEPLDDEEYHRELGILQARLAYLVRKRRFRKHALVLAFEGMDAAGKGGSIRRGTHALDARQYEVVPVSAPTQEERLYPYLWRFWRHVPELGHIAIFDRSWYGRVLVERVRGFTAEPDWRRAYDEISEFERQLAEHGMLVAKFWLAVSKEEQLRRFQSRDTDPLKRFKVDKEDWTNRRHYDEYQSAAAEMIHRTDAPYAKWTVVPADDKKAARLMVLKTGVQDAGAVTGRLTMMGSMRFPRQRAMVSALLITCLAGCASIANRPERPAPSSYECMRVVRDKVPTDVKDSRAHCLAGGLIARYCSITEAYMAGIGKELRDLFGGGDAEWSDWRADRVGIACAGTTESDAALGDCCSARGY